MSIFPEARKGRVSSARIIARGVFAACLVGFIAACSALRLAYNQAPSLAYWWIDGYVDLTEAQTVVMRKDIDAFFAWHRSTEVPAYVRNLQQWQQMATVDSTPDKACSQFEVVKSGYLRMIDRGIEPMSKLVMTLTPAQIQQLQRKYAKNNREFEKKYIRVSNEERLDNLMERALDRYEPLYGTLTSTQVSFLRDQIRNSPFDPQRVNTERLRRQSDLMKTLRELQADQSLSASAVSTALRRWHERVMRSPQPGFPAYSDALVRNGCEQFAAFHNITTPEQRAHAVNVLKDYESDLRSIKGPD